MLTILFSVADLGLLGFIIIWIATGGDHRTLLISTIAFVVILIFIFLREVRIAYPCKNGEMDPWFNPNDEDEPDDSDYETDVDNWDWEDRKKTTLTPIKKAP